jgi:hypothetical protein
VGTHAIAMLFQTGFSALALDAVARLATRAMPIGIQVFMAW